MVGAVSVMELPTLSQWDAGMEHDEDAFNEVSYALSFLLNPPEIVVKQTAAQSIASGTTNLVAITFDTLTKDNDSMWAAGTPTIVTVQTPGWYEIEYAVSWATKSSDQTLRGLALCLNGVMPLGNAIGYAEFINDSVTTPQLWQTYDYFFNVGDTVTLGVIQNSGSALSTASSASLLDQQTFLRLRWASK